MFRIYVTAVLGLACLCTGGVCSECYKPGYFGDKCQHKCPGNCKRCESPNNCTGCTDGFYGKRCNKTCPQNCIVCQSKDNCTQCVHDMKGPKCQCRGPCSECDSDGHCYACPNGSYGKVCEKNCNIGCKDGACDYKTGECTPCISRHTGSSCQHCEHGYYKDKNNHCWRSCSKSCQHQSCDEDTGNCLQCDQSLYRSTCERNCSQTCANLFCDKDTGKCTIGCVHGFSGAFCDADDDTGSQLYVYIGAGVAVLVVISSIAVAVACVRERRLAKLLRRLERRQKGPRQDTSGSRYSAVSGTTVHHYDNASTYENLRLTGNRNHTRTNV